MPWQVKACDLKLADVVEMFAGPYGTATVREIRDGQIHFERPYGATSDFSYTGGVIFYTGIEHMTFAVTSSRVFSVWARKELK